MRWTSPVGHVLRTHPERRYEPIGAREGVGPPLPTPPEPPSDAEPELALGQEPTRFEHDHAAAPF